MDGLEAVIACAKHAPSMPQGALRINNIFKIDGESQSWLEHQQSRRHRSSSARHQHSLFFVSSSPKIGKRVPTLSLLVLIDEGVKTKPLHLNVMDFS
jgi:hypothetical protein